MPFAGDPQGLLHDIPEGLFRDNPVPMAVVDARTGIAETANPALARLLGGALPELVGARLEELDESGELSEYLLLAAGVGEDEPRRHRWRTLDGGEITVEIRAFPLVYGRRTLLVLQVRDVDHEAEAERERMRLRSDLHMAQKDEAVNGLAAGLAHDFNNLLAVILPTVQALRLRLEGDEEVREDLDAVADAIRHARELTDALLTFSGRQAMNPRPVSLNDVVVGMESLVRRTLPESIDLVLNLCEGQAAVNVDPARMEQVVLNLVMNARDAMPEGGHLLVRTDEVELDEDGVAGGALEPGPHALLEVSDNGEGMDEETVERMFRPFFTTRGRTLGAGLGLAVVQGVVEGSGGRIHVSSAPEAGTTVRIHLPLLPGAPRRQRHAPRISAGTVPTGSEKILLVEDAPHVRQQTKRLLERLGYEVMEAATADEALTLHADLWSDDGDHPVDLLITDMVMPGLSGGELVRQLRATRPGLPVLYVSGYRDALDTSGRALPPGIYLAKPFSLRTLAEKVREALAE